MGQICGGYRDLASLAFRNETDHVIRRAKGKGRRDKGTPSDEQQLLSININNAATSFNSLAPNFVSSGIQPTHEELGSGYFLSTLVAASKHKFYGFLDFIADVYVADDYNEILLGGMSAVGLAALGNTFRYPPWQADARRMYVKTVQKVNNALNSPKEATRDGILMTIIVLGLFEVVMGGAIWVRHIYGAAALIELRGTEQFKTRRGLRMFTHLYADLIIACLRERKPIPRHMVLLRAEAAKYVEPTNFIWLSAELILQAIHCVWRCRKTENPILLPEILFEALEVERAYQNYFDVLAVQAPYITIYDPNVDSQIAYKHRYHLYDDIWIIKIWNGARLFRLLIHETIRERILLADGTEGVTAPQLEVQYRNSVRLIAQLQEDIFASAPQVLGYVYGSSHGPTSVPNKPFTAIYGGNFIYWMLYMAARAAVTQDEQRTWVVNQLRKIGNDMGISNALCLADELGTRKPTMFSP